MRFTVTVITDMAKLGLEKIGVRWYRSPGETAWIIESESRNGQSYDTLKKDWLSHQPESYIDKTDEMEEKIPQELIKNWYAQGTRTWKHPETGVYYYLIEDVVFKAWNKVTPDYATYPPTQHFISFFDVVPKEDQDYFRSILVKRPPNADIEHGGVMI